MPDRKELGLRRLLKFFNLSLDKTTRNATPTLTPGMEDKTTGEFRAVNFPTDVKRAMDYFLQNNQIYNPNRDRYELYKSLLFMVRNSGLMLSALQTYITETIEMNNGEKPIQIKSVDKDVERYFYKWLDSIGFNYNLLNELVYDLVLLGDSFLLHSIDLTKGIKEIELIDPFIVRNRIELNVNKAVEFASWSNTQKNFTSTYQSLSQIADMVKNMDDENTLDTFEFFRSYTMGYELKYSVDDEEKYRALPPWALTHFRLFTTKSEFFPFGRPLFINSLAPFQSYKTTEMLIDMLRVASFPKEVIKIKGGNSLSPMDRMVRVNETRQFLENITPVTNTKDNIGVGERIYTIEDLFTYEIQESGVTMDKLGDLDAKLTDLILSTAIPDSLLIPSRGAGGIGGESSQALYFNNKIFQKRVESIKSAILEGFSSMFRLHLTLADRFKGENTEFELSMPINAEMFNADKIQQLNDLFMLADTVINNLATALGVESSQIPADILKDIFRNYLPVDAATIEKWIDTILKIKDDQDNPEGDNVDEEEDFLGGNDVSNDNAFKSLPTPPEEETPPEEGEVEEQPVENEEETNSVEASTEDEGLEGAITDNNNKLSMMRRKTMNKAMVVPPDTSKISVLRKKTFDKRNAIVEKFVKDVRNGEDTLIREAYFKAKQDLGMTQGWLGTHIYWNDSHAEANQSSFSLYNIVREEKMIREEKALEAEKKRLAD